MRITLEDQIRTLKNAENSRFEIRNTLGVHYMEHNKRTKFQQL